jgi:hypothetical protein
MFLDQLRVGHMRRGGLLDSDLPQRLLLGHVTRGYLPTGHSYESFYGNITAAGRTSPTVHSRNMQTL